MMMSRIKVDYDAKFDTLYVGYQDSSMSYGDDSADDIIVLRNIDTDDVTGFTILSFFKKYRNNSLPVLPDGINCSFERDIIPLISF